MMTEIRVLNSDFAKIILANIATADNCRRGGVKMVCASETNLLFCASPPPSHHSGQALKRLADFRGGRGGRRSVG